MKFRALRRSGGFTLIELLVVILIIGILIAVSAPSFLGQTGKAHDSAAKQYLVLAYKAAKADSVDNSPQGSWRTGDDLAAVINSSEPELAPVAGFIDPGNGHVTVLGESTPSHLALRVTSKSGKVFFLTADANGPMQLSDSTAPAGGVSTVSGSTGARNSASHNNVDFTAADPNAATSGDIVITPADAGTSPSGYTLFNAQFTVTAPDATTANPILMYFSHLPVGPGQVSLLQVWRNSALVPDCASATGTIAAPDPCVAARGYEVPNPSVCGPCGGGFIAVYTSQASLWQVGQTGASSPPPPPSGPAEGPSGALPGDISQISQGPSGNNLSNIDFSTPFSWSASSGVVIEDDSVSPSWANAKVVVVDPVSGVKSALPGMPVPSFSPTVSPDGTKIAFTDSAANLEVYDTSTHTTTQIATGLASQWLAKSWSPDSSKLAWTDGANSGSANLFYAAADGSTGAVNLTDTATTNEGIDNESGAWAPAWAPTSDTIAYSRNGNIRVSTLSGVLSTLIAHGGGFYSFPTWGSNGTLAFLSDAPPQGYDVITADASGGAVSTLTHIPASFSYDPMLSFNSDNSYLGAVFHSTVTSDDDLFSIKVSDGTVTDLTPDPGTGAGACCLGVLGAYSWSPSGHWLAYVGNPGDLYEVKVY